MDGGAELITILRTGGRGPISISLLLLSLPLYALPSMPDDQHTEYYKEGCTKTETSVYYTDVYHTVIHSTINIY